MRKPIIWLDGKLIEAKLSLLQSLTPGVLKAKGVFETMRARKGRIIRIEDHLRRLSRGLKVLRIRRPGSSAAIRENIRHVLKANRLQEARVRLMVWQKGGCLHHAVMAEPFQPPTARQYAKGFKAMLVKGHRRKTSVPIKSLDYAIFRDSLQKARAAGFDEALFLNRKDELIEGSRTNIFWVKDDVLWTPPITSGCLPGVTRQAVIECARKLGLRRAARHAAAGRLREADEAFVTNAVLGVVPLTRVGEGKIGNGNPGPITARLREAYNRLIEEGTDEGAKKRVSPGRWESDLCKG